MSKASELEPSGACLEARDQVMGGKAEHWLCGLTDLGLEPDTLCKKWR